MKRNAVHPQRKPSRPLTPRIQWWVAPAAFLAVLMALPVNAGVVFPSDPLASGLRVAPNILFILDDSGSMGWENINNGNISAITGTGFSDGPDTAGVTSGNQNDYTDQTGNNRMYDQNYVTNTLYYDPTTTYQPWMNSTGNRLTGGMSYGAVYDNVNLVTYSGVESNTSGGALDLGSMMRTYYAPKDTTRSDNTYLSLIANYYRYQIPAGGADIVRSEYGTVAIVSQPVVQIDGAASVSGTLDDGSTVNHTLANVSAVDGLDILIKNDSFGSGQRDLNYWVYRPDGGVQCNGKITKGGNKTCAITPVSSGQYKIDFRRDDNRQTLYTVSAQSYKTNSCDGSSVGTTGWTNCSSNRPEILDTNNVKVQRTVANEKINFATWYSYYRTRIKAAKAGAAEAFNPLGNKVRVGYRSLHQNGSNNFDIPVGDNNDGRFVNNDATNGNPATTSRSKWYNRLFSATAADGTPLQSVLNSAGTYFSGSGANGPYGPESGTNQLSCRQNFAVLTTDGYWNGGAVSTGTAGDGANGSTITNGLPSTDDNFKTYQYKQPAPYKDGNSDTLADVAMKFWKTDLRTDMDNNVPSDYSKVAAENDQIGRDSAFWQHMVTFTISIGLQTKSGMSSLADVNTTTTWPAPGNDNANNIDDLLHAAVNGRGAFVSAASPKAFSDGLTAALAKIEERTASFSNAGASDSTQLNSGTMIFTASYVAGRWTGLLRAEGAVSGTETWKTTDTGLIPDYDSRSIFTRTSTLTGGVGAGGIGGGTTFPTTAQQNALARSGGPANYEVSGANNVLYVKGDKSRAGSNPGQLRVRSNVMGDVVNSSPAYVADSDTVFIGANDGMLHAFNASTGAELFAYIPGIIDFSKLADLSRGDYEHRWFVDGPIAISPKALGPGGTKNILVGTLGRGGKGVYALDVTNPSAFTTSDIKWERSTTGTTTATDNMGMVLGSPVLGKVRTAAGVLTSAVMLGNGINSGSDKAALLVLDLSDGTVIREIPTDSTLGNGLFTPTGIYAADGKTLVYAYAGDLQGNVWKFDMTSTNPSAWTAKKIFHAEKTAGTPQPITGGIAVAVDARTNKRWVFFGTGSYLTATDGNDAGADKQSMYGVIDDITTGSAYSRSDLKKRTVTQSSETDATKPDYGERYFEDLKNLTQSGWYVDLPDKGERIVQNAQIDGSFLVTASMMPAGDSCADAQGSGYINAITPFPDMLASGTSYWDLDGDGNPDDKGTDGKPTGSVKTVGMPTLPLLLPGQVRVNTSSGISTKLRKGQPQWNRVSWRELRND